MATKSKGVGRGAGSGGKRPGAGSGGPRPGAGRKPKPGAVLVKAAPVKAKAEQPEVPKKETVIPASLRSAIEAVLPTLDDEAEPTVEELEALAKKAMRQVLQYSMQDAARVSAARMVRDWADAERERAAEANSVTGKKAAAQAAAQDHAAAGGKFAPPPAPIRFQ